MTVASALVQGRRSSGARCVGAPEPACSYTGTVKGAPITVRCDCGKKALVAYGEVWQCDGCARRWNTNQIPAADYWGVMGEMRRFRFKAIRSMLVLAAIFVGLALVVSDAFFILIPLAMSGWYLFYMPRWRQRVRGHARNVPNWELHPE
jgi:hypothetical protein